MKKKRFEQLETRGPETGSFSKKTIIRRLFGFKRRLEFDLPDPGEEPDSTHVRQFDLEKAAEKRLAEVANVDDPPPRPEEPEAEVAPEPEPEGPGLYSEQDVEKERTVTHDTELPPHERRSQSSEPWTQPERRNRRASGDPRLDQSDVMNRARRLNHVVRQTQVLEVKQRISDVWSRIFTSIAGIALGFGLFAFGMGWDFTLRLMGFALLLAVIYRFLPKK